MISVTVPKYSVLLGTFVEEFSTCGQLGHRQLLLPPPLRPSMIC